METNTNTHHDAISALVDGAVRFAGSRRLAAITVGVPFYLRDAGVGASLRRALADAGLPGVEVWLERRGAALRLLSVEFER